MLLIDTFIAASHFHGVGLFSREHVYEGTVICKYEKDFDQFYNAAILDKLFPSLTQEFIKKQSFCFEGNYILFGDNARFINHSKQNNLQFYVWNMSTCLVAIKNIEADTELFLDYSEFDEAQYKKINDLVERRDSNQWPPKLKIPLEKLR
jgi:SET domain-containing protein